MKKLFISILIISIFSIPAFPRLLDSVLKDGIGTRPFGMGGAFTAVSDDSNAIFYNPAGRKKARLEYIRGYFDANKTVYNMGEYSVVSIKEFSFGNWFLEDEDLGRLEVTAISYTRKSKGISYGITIKNVYGNTTNEVVAGNSYDVGLMGRFNRTMTWGINLQDIHEVNLDIPASVRAGIAFDFMVSKLVIEGEGRNLKDTDKSKVYPHIGFESKLTEGFVWRIGTDKDYVTAGFSISVPVLDVEYAIASSKEDPESTSIHRFGFKFDAN